jgi:hypothetical protein
MHNHYHCCVESNDNDVPQVVGQLGAGGDPGLFGGCNTEEVIERGDVWSSSLELSGITNEVGEGRSGF